MSQETRGLDELLRIGQDIALKAGRLIASRRAGTIDVHATKSSDVDVVTAVDHEAETLIRQLLLDNRPGDGFVGEESGDTTSTTGVTWVVDPIDGTVNYLYGIPHYAVSIAAVENTPQPGQWDLQVGIIVNPVSGDVFSARKGHGATLGATPLRVAAPVPLSQSLWLTGFAYSAAYRAEQGRLARELLPRVRDIRRMGTASLDLAAIACGRGNIYFERTLSPWDHAAGELIVHESGGTVSGFADQAPGREAVFAGHPHMVRQFQQAVEDAGGSVPLSDVAQ